MKDILARAGADARALHDGRVFVGRRRVKDGNTKVVPGDELRIAAERRAALPAVDILFQKDGLVACVKPANMPTVPDHGGSHTSLVAIVAHQVGIDPTDIRVTSRLDREVSGVIVFALDPESEARLRHARASGTYTRRYVAIAGGAPFASESAEGIWDAPIGRGKDPRHRAAHGPEGKESLTRWRVTGRADAFVVLAVEPETGRTHQIRVHASHAGAPLFGDKDYGGIARVTQSLGTVVALSRIALHAARVTVPGKSGPLTADAPIPDELSNLWIQLGGVPSVWDTAVSCDLPT